MTGPWRLSSYSWDWERIPRWGTSMSQAWRWDSTGSGEQRTEELKLEREVVSCLKGLECCVRGYA